MDPNKRRKLWVGAVVVFVIALALISYYVDQRQKLVEQKTAEEDAVVRQAREYPVPAAMRTVSGIVQGIYGATIHLEIDDPQDIAPHADGTPRRKLTVFASLLADTKILLVDARKLDAQGNPKKTPLALSGIKVGDALTVTTDGNIIGSQRFDVTEIQKVVF